MVHKLNDGYFIFSALADSPEAVERTFLAIEFTLSAGGFLGDGGEDPQMN
ncbi:hypothetical protein [Corynebacterium ulceribovis]|nr:hypothetical protein [Corynebacterium ulceribovis]